MADTHEGAPNPGGGQKDVRIPLLGDTRNNPGSADKNKRNIEGALLVLGETITSP